MTTTTTQGAIVSISMLLMQRTEKDIPRVKEFREGIEKRISDKYEEILTKFGCVLATGILDAGGKNQTISLHKNGHNLVKPIVGLHMFMQYWYWYPMVLMFSLALQVCHSCDDVNPFTDQKPFFEQLITCRQHRFLFGGSVQCNNCRDLIKRTDIFGYIS